MPKRYNTYIIGPDGTYFPARDAFIVRVDDVNDELFIEAMEFGVDEGWSLVEDSIPGPDIDIHVPWGNPDHDLGGEG